MDKFNLGILIGGAAIFTVIVCSNQDEIIEDINYVQTLETLGKEVNTTNIIESNKLLLSNSNSYNEESLKFNLSEETKLSEGKFYESQLNELKELNLKLTNENQKLRNDKSNESKSKIDELQMEKAKLEKEVDSLLSEGKLYRSQLDELKELNLKLNNHIKTSLLSKSKKSANLDSNMQDDNKIRDLEDKILKLNDEISNLNSINSQLTAAASKDSSSIHLDKINSLELQIALLNKNKEESESREIRACDKCHALQSVIDSLNTELNKSKYQLLESDKRFAEYKLQFDENLNKLLGEKTSLIDKEIIDVKKDLIQYQTVIKELKNQIKEYEIKLAESNELRNSESAEIVELEEVVAGLESELGIAKFEAEELKTSLNETTKAFVLEAKEMKSKIASLEAKLSR